MITWASALYRLHTCRVRLFAGLFLLLALVVPATVLAAPATTRRERTWRQKLFAED